MERSKYGFRIISRGVAIFESKNGKDWARCEYKCFTYLKDATYTPITTDDVVVYFDKALYSTSEAISDWQIAELVELLFSDKGDYKKYVGINAPKRASKHPFKVTVWVQNENEIYDELISETYVKGNEINVCEVTIDADYVGETVVMATSEMEAAARAWIQLVAIPDRIPRLVELNAPDVIIRSELNPEYVTSRISTAIPINQYGQWLFEYPPYLWLIRVISISA